jgi:hypothetical protein
MLNGQKAMWAKENGHYVVRTGGSYNELMGRK